MAGNRPTQFTQGHFRDRIYPAGSSRLLASSNFAHQYPTHTHQGLTRDTVRPARPLLGCPGTKLALLSIKHSFGAILRVLGEFFHAWASNRTSRAKSIRTNTRPHCAGRVFSRRRLSRTARRMVGISDASTSRGLKEKPPLRGDPAPRLKYFSPLPGDPAPRLKYFSPTHTQNG